MIRYQIPTLLLVCALAAPGQTSVNAPKPEDAGALLAEAAPHYDFSSPAMKPWHLKASYQIYDGKGTPTMQGTYEYWWSSRAVHRSSWSRPGASLTVWSTADGKRASEHSGEALDPDETRLQFAFGSPLPGHFDGMRTVLQEVAFGPDKLPCVFLVPSGMTGAAPAAPKPATLHPAVVLALHPRYCFNPHSPSVRLTMMGDRTTQYNDLVSFQDRFLAKQVILANGRQKHIVTTVDSITQISGDDPAFTPAEDAVISESTPLQGIAAGRLIKRVPPEYPNDAKDRGIRGIVILLVTIGKDGAVHDIHVASSPLPSLAAAAQYAVSQWRYTPYEIDGEPVDVKMAIEVAFDR